MPRPAKGARLYLRTDKPKPGESKPTKWWVIRDGAKAIRTGYVESELRQAELKLAAYLGERHDPVKRDADASEVTLADILMVYRDHKHPPETRPSEHKDKPPRLREFEAMISRLNNFWGDMTAADILGPKCREYARVRGTDSGARRDLESLRAAVKLYRAEYGLKAEPVFTLPKKERSRERWLTRDEAARLLWACYRGDPKEEGDTKRNQNRRKHLARFVLIGLYSASRHQAILRLQWQENDQGGHIDLERGVLYRRSAEEGETMKRRPPIRIPNRLLAHLRRWKRMDAGLTHVVHYEGRPIDRLESSFRRARVAAKLDEKVIPHALRHTAVTWAMQAGVPMNEIAGFAGMTIQILERTYAHHHPDHQTNMVSKRMVGTARPKASAQKQKAA